MTASGRSAASVMDTLIAQLSEPSSSWSVGAPGAIAEFHRDVPEPCEFPGPACALTALGAIRLAPHSSVRSHAYEILSARPGAWHHGIALHLPEGTAAMSSRRVVTELGPDREAIREQDRDATLFDLGLGAPHCDYHVRTADPDAISRLRHAAGTSLLEACCDLYDELVRMSPHRVFVSRAGRIEIYQRIAPPGETTPHGPHTHLLPRLFRPARSHLPHTPLPAGAAPCMTLFPANPVFDAAGHVKPFDSREHAAFQALLGRYGDAGDCAVKAAVWRAVRSGKPPSALGGALGTRRQRIAARVALRQLGHLDGPSALLGEWHRVLERGLAGRNLALAQSPAAAAGALAH